MIDGAPTVWCAQHDPLTLEPITAALAWFDAAKLTSLKRTKNAAGKTDYVDDSNSNEVYWARFYDPRTQEPVFAGADDGIIYASYSEMAKHNKVAYDYFTTAPAELLGKEHERWQKRIANR